MLSSPPPPNEEMEAHGTHRHWEAELGLMLCLHDSSAAPMIRHTTSLSVSPGLLLSQGKNLNELIAWASGTIILEFLGKDVLK